MEIKLNARLSAYSKVDAVNGIECDHESVSFEDIDTLFDSTSDNVIIETTNSNEVSFKDIDSLFR